MNDDADTAAPYVKHAGMSQEKRTNILRDDITGLEE